VLPLYLKHFVGGHTVIKMITFLAGRRFIVNEKDLKKKYFFPPNFFPLLILNFWAFEKIHNITGVLGILHPRELFYVKTFGKIGSDFFWLQVRSVS
jgi:hypothetical protein